MCSAYWTLVATFTCTCGTVNENYELQTHFAGFPGSMRNRYQLGEPVAELAGMTVDLPAADGFTSFCEECDWPVSFSAVVRDGAVISVALA